MKLYATVTSERASKGQGGNDYLVIRIYGAGEKPIATVTPSLNSIAGGGKYSLNIHYLKGVVTEIYKYPVEREWLLKGKQQKGEKCYCEESGLSSPHLTTDH